MSFNCSDSITATLGGVSDSKTATFQLDKKYSTLTLVSKSGVEDTAYPGVSYYKDALPTSMGARTGVLTTAGSSVNISDYTKIGLIWWPGNNNSSPAAYNIVIE